MSFTVNLGVALVKAEVNILVSYSIIELQAEALTV